MDRYLQIIRTQRLTTWSIPKYSQLKTLFGVWSYSYVSNIIALLIDQWFLEKQSKKVIVGTPKLEEIPFCDHVRAWVDEMVQPIISTINVMATVCPHPDIANAYEVHGDSMYYMGIYHGDVVIIEPVQVLIGDLVVAVIDWVTTLKYYYGTHLKAWNPDYPDMYPQEQLDIVWVVISLIRTDFTKRH